MIDQDGFCYGPDHTRTKLPFKELDRHHQQAIVVLREALRAGDARAYRSAEQLEKTCRLEKARRARKREGPEEQRAFNQPVEP